jgi:Ca2+-binding RTX toxin-like protein
LRKSVVLIVVVISGVIIAWVTPSVGAHTGWHGDCASAAQGGTYAWIMRGSSSADRCGGHDTGENRDEILTDRGQDRIEGRGGSDWLKGEQDADNLFGGDNGSLREIVQGGPGGGDSCASTGQQTCEKLRGGSGNDRVTDTSGPADNHPTDWDWACDGTGQDEITVRDGDVRDVIECLCDNNGDEWWIDCAVMVCDAVADANCQI